MCCIYIYLFMYIYTYVYIYINCSLYTYRYKEVLLPTSIEQYTHIYVRMYIYIYSPTWYNIRDISLLPLLNSLRRQCREIMMIIHVHNWHKQPAPYEMTLGYSWDTKCSYIKMGIRHDLTVKHMGMFTRYTWYSIYSVSICGMIICTMCTLIDQSYIYIYHKPWKNWLW
jgi:hypothetical protein